VTTILDRARVLAPTLSAIRRNIHQHPELSFHEYRTAALVADTLRSLGIPIDTEIGKTGVVGHLGTAGPIVALRADMDALPMQELNEVEYVSQVPDVMHACGHDAHVACLLGAAMLLKDMNLSGRVCLLFQPSEEGMDDEGKSGAQRMIEDGAMDGVRAIFGLHVEPLHESCSIWLSEGPIASSLDDFKLVIKGIATHGASAYQGVDAILLTAQVVSALHTIVSRRIRPGKTGAVSVGTVQGGTRRNTLADRVEMEGTVRCYDPEVRQTLLAEVKRASELARTLGGDYELTFSGGYPSLINNADLTALVRSAAVQMLGEGAVHPLEPDPGSEDFSYLLEKAPGCYFLLGVHAPGDTQRFLHSPHLDIDESALPVGAAMLAQAALAFLEKQ
jgi:IAA-amino acid hydrolase